MSGLFIKDAGVWKEQKMLWVKDAGVWKEVGGGAKIIPSQIEYTTPGTYTFLAPVEMEVSVVCVGAGGAGYAGGSGTSRLGGGGGALSYGNHILLPANVPVLVTVGTGSVNSDGGASSFGNYVIAGGGTKGINSDYILPLGGQPSGTHMSGGGAGGLGGFVSGNVAGGGGAGGYSGKGGDARHGASAFQPGVGGGGAGASNAYGGGGVGIYGEGPSGTVANQGGSGGEDGLAGVDRAGKFGGGGHSHASNNTYGQGARGAVRIIWGEGRSFPFNAGDV